MSKINFRIVTIGLFSFIIALCLMVSSAVEAATFKVTTNSLNLNLRASIGNGQIIAKMPTGSIVEGEDLGNGWARVTYNGVTGYATMQYLTKISTQSSPNLYNLTAAYPMDGVYTLTPGCATNMNLSIYNDGTANKAQAVIYNAGYRNSSKWKIQRIGNTEWYYIIDMNSGKSLDNEAGRGANGNMISLWPEQGVCQRWRFWQVRSGVYVIQAYTNDQFVLDVAGADTRANTIVQLWPYNTSPAQQWTLNRVATDLRPTTNNTNTFQQYTKTAQCQAKAYATSSLNSVYGNEWVDKGDVVTVLEETSNAYKVRYPVSNGYKERWVSKNIFTVSDLGKIKDALNWLDNNLGRTIGVNHQCVSTVKAYAERLGLPHPVDYGNACDYAYNKLNSGWTRVKNGVPQAGDILVYCGAKYGHVAIYAGNNIIYESNMSDSVYGNNLRKRNRAYDKGWYSSSEGGNKYYWGYIRPNI